MQIKIVCMGGASVGKSACTLQFVQGLFVERYGESDLVCWIVWLLIHENTEPSIEDMYRKQVEVAGEMFCLELLDTAGTEQFSSMRDLYYREGEAFVLVFSLTSPASLVECMEIFEALKKARDNVPTTILVGNKADLADQRLVARELGMEKAAVMNASYFECSAKSGEGVHEVFNFAAQQVVLERKIMAKRMGGGKAKRKNATCTLL